MWSFTKQAVQAGIPLDYQGERSKNNQPESEGHEVPSHLLNSCDHQSCIQSLKDPLDFVILPILLIISFSF